MGSQGRRARTCKGADQSPISDDSDDLLLLLVIAPPLSKAFSEKKEANGESRSILFWDENIGDAVAYDVDGRLHRAWLLRQDSCPLGVLWNYYGDAGRGDTQEEMDAYNEFNTYGEFMDNPVAPWFANGDDENVGPDASTYFMG